MLLSCTVFPFRWRWRWLLQFPTAPVVVVLNSSPLLSDFCPRSSPLFYLYLVDVYLDIGRVVACPCWCWNVRQARVCILDITIPVIYASLFFPLLISSPPNTHSWESPTTTAFLLLRPSLHFCRGLRHSFNHIFSLWSCPVVRLCILNAFARFSFSRMKAPKGRPGNDSTISTFLYAMGCILPSGARKCSLAGLLFLVLTRVQKIQYLKNLL